MPSGMTLRTSRVGLTGILQMLQDPKAYLLALVYFFLLGATYTMVFWVPTLIQSWGVKDLFLIGIYASIPNAAGIIGMILIGRHSDKWNVAPTPFCCLRRHLRRSAFSTTTLFQGNLVGSILALAVAVIGIASATPLFFALTSEYLSAGAAAGGLALISSLGNLGPAVSPSINGLILIEMATIYSIYFVMALYLLSGTLLLVVIRPVPKGLSAAASAY